MPFTFTVEDGTGIVGANSYVSVSEADDYYTIDPNFTATWTALTNTQKEYLLAWSTRILDQKCTWYGTRVSATQALRWPRRGTYDGDGFAIDSDEIPDQLKEATFEFAKWLHTNDPTVGQDVDALRKLVVDVIEIEFQEGTTQSSFPSIINAILSGIGRFNTGGRGHGRIVRS